MGDPRRARRRYDTPTHPWQGERIKEEDEYVRKFGLKNKRELWRAQTQLRRFRGQARTLLPGILGGSQQAKKEADQVITRLNRLGILEEGAELADVLALDVDSILGRRLQTVVYRKGLARTPGQARQLIVHGHIGVGGRRVDVPSYLVPRTEETAVEYAPGSALENEAHPARPELSSVAQSIVEEGEDEEPHKKGKPASPPGKKRLEKVKEQVKREGGEVGDEDEDEADIDEAVADEEAPDDAASEDASDDTPSEETAEGASEDATEDASEDASEAPAEDADDTKDGDA